VNRDQHSTPSAQTLKQDRTKSFLVLAGLMVMMTLLFFAMFSSPSRNRKNTAHPNSMKRGRRPGSGNTADDRHSVIPNVTYERHIRIETKILPAMLYSLRQ
jgi:hypothetical protein